MAVHVKKFWRAVKRLFQTNTESLSYKQAVIQLMVAISAYALGWHRRTFYVWLGVGDLLEKYEFVDILFGVCILCPAFLIFYCGISGIIVTFENRLEQKKRQKKMIDKKAKKTGKQYSLENIMKILRENDILEFEVKALTGVITIGASSDCEPGGFKFFDKTYYINDEEFELDQEKEFLEKLSHMCGGESITVLSIDGVKVK